MAIQVECPKCKQRNSLKTNNCSCGFVGIKKHSGKVYWIDYRVGGIRKREKIGRSKQAAENRLREVETQKVEKRYIRLNKDTETKLSDLFSWYLLLPEVRSKKSFKRDCQFVEQLSSKLKTGITVDIFNQGMADQYMIERQNDDSPTFPGQKIKPATVNKEISCLKTIFNRAVKHQKISSNPLQGYKLLAENNVRMRILSKDEYHRLINACPDYMKPIIKTAFHLPMRLDEIIKLTWDKVDLIDGFIRLEISDTKTKSKRSIPIHPIVKTQLETQSQDKQNQERVFLRNGKPIVRIFNGYKSALKRAEIENFTFHDLRHCAINNLRLAKNDHLAIMAMSGHKTMSMFRRYNLVTETELKDIKWE
jgi:integrase